MGRGFWSGHPNLCKSESQWPAQLYSRDLMTWLHDRLAERGTFNDTLRRFERLRGCSLLPRGRENAGVRLSNDQIANAVLGFVHPLPGYAGHASLILGGLCPVGGVGASFRGAESLRGVVATLIEEQACFDLRRLTLSVERDFGGDEYAATLYVKENGHPRTVSFASGLACTLLRPGAEEGYDHEHLDRQTAVQRSFGLVFFRDLSRDVSVSRQLDRPLKTDWSEYETEEEKAEFHRRLGAHRASKFLNLRVDAQVTWPNEPTRIEFGGHHLVLFPKTKDNSHSISIDLALEHLSEDDAVSLANRLLSVMSWCNDRPASVHEGWSGNPVPVPVPRLDLAFVTAHQWVFFRTLPEDENLLRCLAYYRDGLNAYSAGLASHAVLSFYRVFETRHGTKNKAIDWVNSIFPDVEKSISKGALGAFELDRQSAGADVGTYVYENCRVATAHAARDMRSDPDGIEESRRLLAASRITQALARHFIKTEYQFSDSYLSDDYS